MQKLRQREAKKLDQGQKADKQQRGILPTGNTYNSQWKKKKMKSSKMHSFGMFLSPDSLFPGA